MRAVVTLVRSLLIGSRAPADRARACPRAVLALGARRCAVVRASARWARAAYSCARVGLRVSLGVGSIGGVMVMCERVELLRSHRDTER